MHLSYSKIKAYLECPLKFKFIYIDRIPQKPKPYFKFSHIIHTTLSRYHFYQKKSLDELLTFYNEAFKSSSEKSERLYQEGKQILINFFRDFQDASVYRVEEKFKVRLGPYILSGKIDRVDKVNGGYELIDYKISKSIPSQKEVKDSLQLGIYSAGFYKLTKIVPLRTGFYYLRYRQKLFVTPTEENIRDTIKLIYSIGGKIRGGKFPAREGPFCKLCDYKGRCPAKAELSFPQQLQKEKQLRFWF